MTSASTLDAFTIKKKSLHPSTFSSALSTTFSAWERSLPFPVSSEHERKCNYLDWGEVLPTIWPSSMESTRGGALCWQRTKQRTKWTPGQIKIHQDIWIGCPVSKLFASIKSKVKRNVPLLHISVIIVVSERVRHAPEWKNLLDCLVWSLTLPKGMVRYGKQSKRLEMENSPCFFIGGHASTV